MTTPTQGEHAQTEALRLADDLEASSLFPGNMRSCNNAAAAELRRLHAKVTALTAALGVQAEPVKDEATCQMCGEKPYPGCNSEFQDEAACRFYHPVTAQTALAHELFAAAQLAPGEGIEDAVSRIAAALTAATAQPAAPQCVAYAELDDAFESWLEDQDVDRLSDGYESWLNSVRSCWDSALRASHGQAPASRITVEQVEDAIGLQSTAWDTIGAEKIVEAVLRLANGQAPAGATHKDSTPGLHVGESAFESWYSTYNPAHKADKQRARDAYDAGMGDPLVTAAPTPQPAPAAGAVAGPGWKLVPLEPTVDQEWEGKEASRRVYSMAEACKIYKAMLAVAPTPAAQADSQPAAVLEGDRYLDAWKCERCHGKGWHWQSESVNHGKEIGVENVDLKTHCDACEGCGWCGPDADHAARAPADSVLEDAARYRWLRRWKGQEHEPLFTVQHEVDGTLWGGDLDAAVDAARKQGAKHD